MNHWISQCGFPATRILGVLGMLTGNVNLQEIDGDTQGFRNVVLLFVGLGFELRASHLQSRCFAA
jgi:hypothetical protein